MKPYPLFRLANYLYKYASGMYVPLYTAYKIISDKTERTLIKTCVKAGDCVVDIGANIGVYTQFFANLVGQNGEVHAFEPDPTNFGFLKKRTQNLRNVNVHQAAVSNQTGKITLFLSDDLNVDHRTYQTEDVRNTRTVDCFCLDEYLHGKKVDFIKMDIQGHEYTALLGMRDTLRRNGNVQMMIELWPYGLTQAGSNHHAVLQFLLECDFDIYLILKNTIVKFTDMLINCKETDYYSLFVTRQPFDCDG